MDNIKINQHLNKIFQDNGLQECPMNCISVKTDELYLEFKYLLVEEKAREIFKSVSLIILADFKNINRVKTQDLEYTRIGLEKDILMARLRAGL